MGKAKLPRCVGCLIGQDLFLAQDLSYGVLVLICCIYNKQQIRKSSNLLYICIFNSHAIDFDGFVLCTGIAIYKGEA